MTSLPVSHKPPMLRITLTRLDWLLMGLIVLAYGLFFVIDVQSPEFVYSILGTKVSTEELEIRERFDIADYATPWRYRIVPRVLTWWLFRLARTVSSEANLTSAATPASGFFMALSFALFYLLLKTLNLPPIWALVGGVGAGVAFPVLFGYRGLNHMTLDDTLSYALVILGLLSLFHRRYGWYVGISIVAGLTRETTLLLIFVVLFDRELPLIRRGLFATPAFVITLLVRLILWETSPMTEASGLPLVQWSFNVMHEGLLITGSYAYATFGVFWFLGVLGWLSLLPQRASLTRPCWLFWASTPMVVGILAIFNWTIALVRENRIMFLVFPWVIGLSIIYLYKRWTSLLTWRHIIIVITVLLMLAIPPLVFLLLVPGGSGQRLETLSRLPYFADLYQNTWLVYRDRFSWIPGHLPYLFISFILGGLLMLWLLVDRLLVLVWRTPKSISA